MSTADQEREKREAKQRLTNLAFATQQTNELRNSEEPRWQRLRRHLEQEGVAVGNAALANKNTEDGALEFGLIVTRDGRAFGFEFDFWLDEEGRRIEYEDARVSEWEELDQRRRAIYGRELATGQEVLERETPTEKPTAP